MKARLWQAQSGMIQADIRDEDGDIVSATTTKTCFEAHQWLFDHGIKGCDLEFIQNTPKR